jgi:hypothetical protein
MYVNNLPELHVRAGSIYKPGVGRTSNVPTDSQF